MRYRKENGLPPLPTKPQLYKLKDICVIEVSEKEILIVGES